MTCAYCGDATGPFHLDHVVPRSRGGPDGPSNSVTACRSCNVQKSDRLPSEWLDHVPPAVAAIESRIAGRMVATARSYRGGTGGVKLATLEPERVADHVVALMIAHVRRLAARAGHEVHVTAMPSGAPPVPIWSTTQRLATYAKTGSGDAAISDAHAVFTALFSTPRRRATFILEDDLPKAVQEDTPHGLTLKAAHARLRLEDDLPVSSRYVALLSGLAYQTIRQLGSRGEIAVEAGEVKPREAKRWLGVRGVPGFGRR